jgi:hypothetical protein
MKVYVVTYRDDYDRDTIVGIYSTHELATKVVKECNYFWYSYDIEEYKVDES